LTIAVRRVIAGGAVDRYPADAARTREETAMIDRYYREPRHHARSIVPDLLAGLVALLLTCFVVGAALGKANYTDGVRHVAPFLRPLGLWMSS
jgi:hypothetical protein